jgi:5-deoxy-glucuronate isomerase
LCKNHPESWKYSTPNHEGWHIIADPHNSALKVLSIFRLNLAPSDKYVIYSNNLELNMAVISGSLYLSLNGSIEYLEKRDSFYLSAGDEAELRSGESGVVVYIGGAPYLGIGKSFIRKFVSDLPLGLIHQIHGEGIYSREIFMSVDPGTPASLLITGFTWGKPGAWTSWPPHQHSEHLEEVYFYFDIPEPAFALQLLSRKSGTVEFVHSVHSGDCIIIPEGYHPTVGMPGVSSSYFWIMGAHSITSRRYDLAVEDPAFIQKSEKTILDI